MSGRARTLPDGWVSRWVVGPAIYAAVVTVALVVVFDDSWGEALFMAVFLGAFVLIMSIVATRRARHR